MNLHLLFETASAVRLGVVLVIAGSVLLLYARLLFGPFPKTRACTVRDHDDVACESQR